MNTVPGRPAEPLLSDAELGFSTPLKLVNTSLEALVRRHVQTSMAGFEVDRMRRFLLQVARCNGGELTLSRADWDAACRKRGTLVIEADAAGNIRILAE